ncbi:phenylalanine--tRNA ligase beta subunit-related protein [Jeotgalibacillus sp. ET6]|uniref:B3/B4 domain-containing protein n=1 Tax=Jeotgalibacillus sp. ET6 TaxID=3037260 RepID=UPI0024188779|nr:phenylalanine--tRNA ligase beta subunit-related protein [Jeotgalibacillus sp. ET6]MDG5473351.1 phenylalanine--tRNA ligase beta subunit-related protein [Jeotgalibacillus sp. ET6]
MKVSIHPSLHQQKEPLSFGIIHYQDIQVGESPQMLKGRLQLFQESIFFELQETNVADLEGVREWRDIFKALGKDPNRYRHSAESLYRRIKKKNYLSPVHSAVDLNNFFSLEYQSPIGLYDTSQIKGDVSIRLGKPGEEYQGLNGRSNSLENLLVSVDQNGAFGSPFVDSERTAINQSTTEALQIIYLRPSLTPEAHIQLTDSLKSMFIQVHGGSGKSYIVSTTQ